MKEINSCFMEKYKDDEYIEVSDGIYLHNNRYVTCLSFKQEPEFGEGETSSDISQYPLEDILDRFSVYISDFFSDENVGNRDVCILEFTGFSQECIEQLRGIIGKHVYNRNVLVDNQGYVELVIE